MEYQMQGDQPPVFSVSNFSVYVVMEIGVVLIIVWMNGQFSV